MFVVRILSSLQCYVMEQCHCSRHINDLGRQSYRGYTILIYIHSCRCQVQTFSYWRYMRTLRSERIRYYENSGSHGYELGVAPCNPAETGRRFRGAYCFPHCSEHTAPHPKESHLRVRMLFACHRSQHLNALKVVR
jgi:hypothetical protein